MVFHYTSPIAVHVESLGPNLLKQYNNVANLPAIWRKLLCVRIVAIVKNAFNSGIVRD